MGEAGVGKSRLALEAARRGALAPAAGVVVRCVEGSTTTPFHALADALRSAPARAALATFPAVWKRDLAALLPELAAADAARATDLASTRDEARDEARARLLEALAQALAHVAGAGGVVVVDDLQWADASTLDAVMHLARRQAQDADALPRVIATARRHELGTNAVALLALQGLERDGLLMRLQLGAFDAWQMLQFVHALSRREGGVRFAARLAAATAGNVFFALETIRALLECGELRVDADRGWSTRFDGSPTGYAELPLPRSVVDAVHQRVARIGAAAVRLLETASLAEPGCTLAELRGATALNDWEALDAVEHAIEARVLERAGDGYRFAHDLIAHAVRHALSPERRRLIHGRLATTLEPLGAPAACVAAHWQEAGDAERAAAAWERAGDAALALHALREAATHFERAGELSVADERAVTLFQRALQTLFIVAVSDDPAAARLIARIEAHGSPLARFSALLHGGQSAAHRRRYAQALRLAREALAKAVPGHPTLHLQALNIAAFSESHLGRLDDGYATYIEALSYARANDIVRGVPMMAASASEVAVQRGRLDEAAPLVAEALRTGRAAMADDVRFAQVLNRASRYGLATGDHATAVSQLDEACSITHALKAWGYLPIYLANVCEALVDDGRGDEADARHREALSLPQEARNDGRFVYLTAFSRAFVDEQLGRLGDAPAQARFAVQTADRHGDLSERREARFVLARLLASVAAEAATVAVRLAAAGADPDPADVAAAADWLDGGRVRPTVALDLMRALQPHLPRRAQPRGREHMRALAQRLADSLSGEPELQGAFIRRHRDLLT